MYFLYYVVDGGWSNWSAVKNCSEHCGGGDIVKTRNCSNPAPLCGGKDCNGTTVIIEKCNTMDCIGLKILYTASNVIVYCTYIGVILG